MNATNVTLNFDDSDIHYKLLCAILIYGSQGTDGNSESQYLAATVHPVEVKHDKPIIQAGRPITIDVVEELARNLGSQVGNGIIPANVVQLGLGRMAWFSPARRTRIWFIPSHQGTTPAEKAKFKEVRKLNGLVVHHPPLLFVARRGLSVYALAQNQRPDGKTPVLRSPYWNLHNGAMCAGNLDLPAQPVPDAIPDYERAFFNSAFTHNNSAELLTHFPGGHVALWRDLHRRKKAPDARYWQTHLVDQKKTVAAVLRSHSNE